MCELVASILGRIGLKVFTFSSAEAFTAAHMVPECGKTPCCLLLDLVMPGQSGLDLLENRCGGSTPPFSCPVIVITAPPLGRKQPSSP